jgi:hypothetical protein
LALINLTWSSSLGGGRACISPVSTLTSHLFFWSVWSWLPENFTVLLSGHIIKAFYSLQTKKHVHSKEGGWVGEIKPLKIGGMGANLLES